MSGKSSETEPIPEPWRRSVCAWAAKYERIEEVSLFGSRAKGRHKVESDIDLAVRLSGTDPAEMDGYWICFVQRWREELTRAIPVPVDLQFADPESDQVVWPAVQQHGIRLYVRSEQRVYDFPRQ